MGSVVAALQCPKKLSEAAGQVRVVVRGQILAS